MSGQTLLETEVMRFPMSIGVSAEGEELLCGCDLTGGVRGRFHIEIDIETT